ncbi:MAG: hypothetical protein V1773_03080 [bacterium]
MNKFFTRFILLLLVIIPFLSGCFDAPKDPVMPTWDVELNLPLVNKTLTLNEILDTRNNPNVGINAGQDSLYFIYVSNLETKATVTDSLKLGVKLIPDTLNLSGTPTDGTVRSSIIYNPDKDYRLLKAEFKSGSFVIDLANTSAFPVNYELVLPGFKKNSDGSVLKISGTMSAGTNKSVETPLKDYTYTELDIIEGANDLVEPYTFQAAPGFYFVGKASASGAFDISFVSKIKSDAITLSRMEGKIKRTTLPYTFQQFGTGFGDEITNFKDALDFENITVSLNAGVFGEMKNIRIIMDSLTLIGYDQHKNGSLFDPLTMQFNSKNYLRDSLSTEENFIRTFDKSNTNVTNFLLHLPKVIKMGSKFSLANIPNTKQVISDRDSFKIVTSINAPVSIKSKNATYKDTLEIEMSADNRTEVQKANTASITLEVENHIPMGLKGSAIFVDKNYKLLFKVHTDEGAFEIDVPPSEVNSSTGFASTPTTQSIKLELTKNEIDLFSQAKYVIAEVFIKSTGSTSSTWGSTFVKIRAKDFIKYKLHGSVNYKVDTEKD